MKIITPREKELSNQVVNFLRKRKLIPPISLERELNLSLNSINRSVKNDNVFISSNNIFNIIEYLVLYGINIFGEPITKGNFLEFKTNQLSIIRSQREEIKEERKKARQTTGK
ncbi:hypothetical protein CLV98_1235 [Dyadobacter jejuensis]|uniref:Uncharacterized protein n=1 Tax=Dyadobacter jejuensis TaxID=1082580 RepID=A0A316A7F1_9BACT|nr:hypothetical protein [Dyadobacter jejuensis]PWJ53392.1 hypothetical protein CLV98_1235 [Dyadobacter jejuensis]